MTAAVYSLHKFHPGKYITAVVSPHPEVWENNPDVVPLKDISTQPADVVAMHYPSIHDSNSRGIHFMQGWCEHLSNSLGVRVPLMTDRPKLYFLDQDPKIADYWVVCSGGKKDFTLKLWGQERYQEVIDRLRGRVRFLQVGSGCDDHPRLDGVEYRVGSTSLRDLFDLVRRARGVLCGITLLMHVAAALGRPAIVVAGGREPVQWNAYPKQHYLHTVGVLPCCTPQGEAGGACWRSRVVALGDNKDLDSSLCQYPEGGVGKCMTLVDPEEVAKLVLRYSGA